MSDLIIVIHHDYLIEDSAEWMLLKNASQLGNFALLGNNYVVTSIEEDNPINPPNVNTNRRTTTINATSLRPAFYPPKKGPTMDDVLKKIDDIEKVLNIS